MFFILTYPFYALHTSPFQLGKRYSFLSIAIIRIQLAIVASWSYDKVVLRHDHPPVI